MHSQMLLNNRKISFSPGETILEVAQTAGILIPTLCHWKEADHSNVCRICVVEVKGVDRLLPACSTLAREDMEVWTETERVVRSRRQTLELLLAAGRHSCLACEASGDCRLQDLAYQYGVEPTTVRQPADASPSAPEEAFIIRDYSKCVLCGRCVAACGEIQVNGAIAYPFGRREDRAGPHGWFPLPDPAKCVSCGQCVEACPVGALTEKKARGLGRAWETQKVRTTCPYCGVGCQQWVHVKDGQITKVTAVTDAAPNIGRLCVKGRFAYDFVYGMERLTTPLIKENEQFRPASWDEVLDLVAARFRDIIRLHGPDSVAGLSWARALNEDSYNLQKLFRAVFGTNNIDLCGHTGRTDAANGLSLAFGNPGAMTNSLGEFANARMLVCIGIDMTETHPIAATFVRNAVRLGAELIVIDHVKHLLCDHAALIAPIRPGTEVAFLNGLMHVILRENIYDKEFVERHCEGFEELKALVKAYSPERTARICGVSRNLIRQIACRLAAVRPAMVCYAPSLAGGTAARNKEVSIASLQMLLGNIGVECGGVNPLRVRNNAQGACDMGALPDVLPGYQKVTDPAAREKFSRFWGIRGLPAKPGLRFSDMLDALADGAVKAFYCFGENPAKGRFDYRHVYQCLASAEFLVCQDIFPTEMNRYAHVVLPSAAWCEDDGTFTSTERRVNRVRKGKEPPGLARPNWWIFREIARRMGQEWASASAQEIWDNEVSVLVPILAGIKYRRIEGNGLQWPCPTEDHPGTPVLHRAGDFPRGKGLFVPVEWTPPT
ncbi:MAG: molybdopterin-dependent oxidoreductase [Desulfovibrionales bacterium]|nr:molybdopterin-dependent oxidoreductase [Desulfovibrionales bacterium]